MLTDPVNFNFNLPVINLIEVEGHFVEYYNAFMYNVIGP